MAPVLRPAFTRAQRLELADLAELAASTPRLRPAYGRARGLVLEGSTAEAAAARAIAELERVDRLDRRALERRGGHDRRDA